MRSKTPARSKTLAMAMASLSRLLPRRHFSAAAEPAVCYASSILNPSDPNAVLTSKQKSRLALSLLKSSSDPSQILSICRAAALTPSSHLDRTALSIATSKLASSNSFIPLRSLLDETLNLSSTHPAHSIVLFGQAGLLDDSVRVFKSRPSLKSFNSLLFAAILAKKHSEVGRIFRDFPSDHGIVPDLESYNTVIKAFAESGLSRSIYSMLDEMGKRGIRPNMTTFCNALEGFYREEKFDDVKKVLELMRKNECHPSVATYNVRVQSLCKLKKAKEARELMREMRKKGMKPNWVTYSHLIIGFCKEGDLEEAKRLYKEMGKKGCVAESSCYFSLVHYLCQGGDFEAALGVCKEIMERNWVPCFKTMKMLVNGLVGSSKVDEAKEIVEKMKERFPGKEEMWKEVEEGLLQ